MGLKIWLERHAPDFIATGRRFPLAILCALAVTAIVIGALEPLTRLEGEFAIRTAAGLATAAILAVAGVLFSESRPDAKITGALLKYALPVLAIVAFQLRDTSWLVPVALPLVAIFWLSVSPFTRIGAGEEREAQQNRFWLLNVQAITGAALAACGFAIIALGAIAIERSIAALFGIELGKPIYEWVLPIVAFFLAPVYWLSTLPTAREIQSSTTERQEFVAKAVAFLGQFILAPLLLIYAAILIAYIIQIVLTQHLPSNMIGWMVLGFVTTGAGTWLLLHPPYMRSRPLVRLFRTYWFWLTLLPLGLFFYAVSQRIDGYGLTPQRTLLLAGGVWALVLALLFLVRRGDIRLMPALAGGILLLLSVGPWNFLALPVQQQLHRLDALVANAGADLSQSPPRSNWSSEDIYKARAIIDFLSESSDGQQALRAMMGRYGVTWPQDRNGSVPVLEALNLMVPPEPAQFQYATLQRAFETTSVDVSATPHFLRPIILFASAKVFFGDLRLELQGNQLRSSTASEAAGEVGITDLSPWLVQQSSSAILAKPWIDFAFKGTRYRVVVDAVDLDRGPDGTGAPTLTQFSGLLFADRPAAPAATPTP